MSKKKRKRKKKVILSAQDLDQKNQAKEIRALMKNMGFTRIPRVDGREFVYEGRTSELDDIFFFKNVIVLAEYTVGDPGSHLKNKILIYDRINNNPKDFVKYLYDDPSFQGLKSTLDSEVLNSYTFNQLQIRIIYASKNTISSEHKGLARNVQFFDYSIVKYFESISKIIKRTSIYEFIDFLNVQYGKFAENIKGTATGSANTFSGHILPEEHSTFKEGYKLVSFYIDAYSLLKRSFVLRRDGWKNKENVGLYQRMFVAKKIKSMRKYLHSEKRVFINNLIVTLPIDSIKLLDVDDKQIRIDAKGNFKDAIGTKVQPATISIEDKANIIGIIDGQHRLYCYHEGDDVYEDSIKKLRNIQNLLITGILFPKNETEEKRIKFEANLFLEINSNQSSASTQLKQEIEFMRNPFSTVSISKYIVNKLNDSGPLTGLFEEYWFQKAKLKTSSIISFGLNQLVKYEGADSLFTLWKNRSKNELKSGSENYDLLSEYRDFLVKEIRKIFIGLKQNIPKERWKVDHKDRSAILSVTTINGLINCLRILIENGKVGDEDYYRSKFNKAASFQFKNYKSSQYRKMGEDLYHKFF